MYYLGKNKKKCMESGGGSVFIVWSGITNGEFSGKNVYIMNFSDYGVVDNCWAFIWNVKLRPKVKCFL